MVTGVLDVLGKQDVRCCCRARRSVNHSMVSSVVVRRAVGLGERGRALRGRSVDLVFCAVVVTH